MTDYNIFDLGNLRLQGGATLRGAWIAYKTYGTLNAAKDNAIVFPTFFGGQHYAEREHHRGWGRRWTRRSISSSCPT